MNKIRGLTDDIAENIAKSQLSQGEIILNMCDICVELRKTGVLCALHRDVVPALPKKCNVCSEIYEKGIGLLKT